MVAVRRRLGVMLQDKRKHAEMSQTDLAEATDLALTTVSQLERGAIAPSLTTLVFLAEALNAPIAELFTFAELPPHDTVKRRAERQLIRSVRGMPPERIRTVAKMARLLRRHDGGEVASRGVGRG